MRRRELLRLSGVLSGGAILGACGTSEGLKGRKVPIYGTVATWAPGFVKAGKALQQVCGYGLDAIAAPNVGSYEQIVNSRLQTSRAPDVFKWWNGYRLQNTARTGTIEDLNSIWDEFVHKGWVDPGIRDGLIYQDRVYGMPLTVSYYVVFYSKKLYAKYRLRPPETWDELIHNAEVLKKNGVTPFFSTQYGGWPALIWFQEFISKTDPDFYKRVTAGKASYDEPAGRAAMELWADLIRKEYFTKADVDMANAPALMHAGSVAMFPIGTWNNQAFQAVGMKPGVDYDAFLLPTIEAGTKKSIITEVATLPVSQRAPDKDAALTVMKNWLNPKVQAAWMSFLADIPPNPTVPSTDPVIKNIVRQVKEQQPELLIRYWEASPPPLIEGNVQDLGGFMIHPDDPKQLLSDMQSRGDKEWKYWRSET